MRYEDLIDVLIDRRYSLHLSQNRLAEYTGIYQPMIHRYEKLITTMQLKTLLAIMDGLRLTLTVERVNITSGADVFGVVRHQLIRTRQTPEDMMEAAGYPRAAGYHWHLESVDNMSAARLLHVLAALHLEIRITEREGEA